MQQTIREQLASRLQKTDGVDHINVHVFGVKTEVGKILHPEFRRRFFIPNYGEYLSAICFLRWIGGCGEQARYDSSIRGWNRIDSFQEAIVLAKFCQIKKFSRKVIDELNTYKINTFVSYKVHPNGVRETDYRWNWYINLLPELISQAVDPDLKMPNWEALGFGADSLEKIDEDVKKYVLSQYDDPPEEEQAPEESPAEEQTLPDETEEPQQ
jgi:hypothetical protein